MRVFSTTIFILTAVLIVPRNGFPSQEQNGPVAKVNFFVGKVLLVQGNKEKAVAVSDVVKHGDRLKVGRSSFLELETERQRVTLHGPCIFDVSAKAFQDDIRRFEKLYNLSLAVRKGERKPSYTQETAGRSYNRRERQAGPYREETDMLKSVSTLIKDGKNAEALESIGKLEEKDIPRI
jgi:hypothetical protein